MQKLNNKLIISNSFKNKKTLNKQKPTTNIKLEMK
jgi:hypothetical protein